MGRWGLLLFGVSAMLLSSVTCGDDRQNFEKSLGEGLGYSKCDNDPKKESELKDAMDNFTNCIQVTMAEKLTDKQPMDCKMLSSVSNCFREYMNSVSECLEDAIPNWNKTRQSIESVRTHLCKDDNLIDEYYRVNGIECLRHTDVRKCGSTLSVHLLNPSDNSYDKALLSIKHEPCWNVSEINSCVVEKLRDKTICPAPKAVTIFIKLNEIIANTTGCAGDKDGANVSSISSTFIWILAISVTGLVILTPS